MMNAIADWIMQRRAQRLLTILTPYLTDKGLIIDLGSGTGHNAQAIREATSMQVCEFDVADIHWVGPSPAIIVDKNIPLENGTASLVLILHVLHYCAEPGELLAEAARICRGSILVLQTTCESRRARNLLRVQEFFFGRFGYYLARLAGLVTAGTCPLKPKRCFDRQSLQSVFTNAGLRIHEQKTHSHPQWPLRCDLYQLRKD